MLAEICGVGGGEFPAKLIAFADPCGVPKRIVADYPNGWRLRVNLSARGLTYTASMTVRVASKPKGIAT